MRKIEGTVAAEGLRPREAELPLDQRLDSFNEVSLGLTEEQAVAEAERCLRCDCKDIAAGASPIAVVTRLEYGETEQLLHQGATSSPIAVATR